MPTTETAVREALEDLAPKGFRGPHSQYVKGYNRALRDMAAALPEYSQGDQHNTRPAVSVAELHKFRKNWKRKGEAVLRLKRPNGDSYAGGVFAVIDGLHRLITEGENDD